MEYFHLQSELFCLSAQVLLVAQQQLDHDLESLLSQLSILVQLYPDQGLTEV
jgi:hypothetical protein